MASRRAIAEPWAETEEGRTRRKKKRKNQQTTNTERKRTLKFGFWAPWLHEEQQPCAELKVEERKTTRKKERKKRANTHRKRREEKRREEKRREKKRRERKEKKKWKEKGRIKEEDRQTCGNKWGWRTNSFVESHQSGPLILPFLPCSLFPLFPSLAHTPAKCWTTHWMKRWLLFALREMFLLIAPSRLVSWEPELLGEGEANKSVEQKQINKSEGKREMRKEIKGKHDGRKRRYGNLLFF